MKRIFLLAVALAMTGTLEAGTIVFHPTTGLTPVVPPGPLVPNQYQVQMEWLAGDNSILSIQNNTIGKNLMSLTLSSSNATWSFDQLVYLAGGAATVLSPDGVNDGIRGPANIAFAGLPGGLGSQFSFDIDHPLANQLRDLSLDLGNSTWTVAFSDGFAGTGTFTGLGPFSGNLAVLTGTGVAAVPEPSTMALLSVGMAGFVARQFRRKKKKTETPVETLEM